VRGRLHGRPVPFGRLAIVVQALVALAFVVYLVTSEGVTLPFVTSPRAGVTVLLADAGGLRGRDRSPVTVAGVPEGRVTSVKYRNGLAVVHAEIARSARRKLHADASAEVVPQSALGNLTLDITPGSRAAPPLGKQATITAARTRGPVGIDQVVGVLDADTRAQLTVLLAELHTGLSGRSGALAADLRELEHAVSSGGHLTATLARRRVVLTRLVRNAARVLQTVGVRNRELADAVAGGSKILRVTARRDAALATSVADLPATLAELRRGLRGFTALAPPLRTALARLRPLARSLPAAARSLRRTLPAADTLVADVSALARDGSAPARAAAGVARQLRPVSAGLLAPLRSADTTVAAIDKNKDGIGLLGERFSGIFSTNDAIGPVLRGLGSFEPFDPADFGFGGATGTRLTRVKLGVVEALTATCLHSDPLACLLRYLIPGLPGAVRSVANPLGRLP
jgi:phospholipid/cholesterol/gamma-HCH transport system substrate-binding protein